MNTYSYACKLSMFWGSFIIAVLIPLISFAEINLSKEIYFLNGTPTPDSDGKFPSSIYKLDPKTAQVVLTREIVSSESGSDFIHYYYYERLIIIGQNCDSGFKISIVTMDSPLKESSIIMDYSINTCSYIYAYLLNIQGQGLFQVLRLRRKKEPILIGANLTTLKKEDLSWDLYKYFSISGIPGVNLPGGDCFYLNHNPDGILTVPIGKGKSIETDWKIPASITFSKDDVIIAYVNNNEMLALSSMKSHVPDPNGLGHTMYYIFNKKNKEWYSVKFQGGETNIRGFGNWLAGYVADVGRGVDSPGRKERRQTKTATGTPVDWRLDAEGKSKGIYSPGILVLYNLNDQKQYSIQTNQGDNEVLLVEDDIVYYRANRSIFMAKISEKGVEAGTLMIENDIVPDIHWMFTRINQ
ncbi:MAG: hypothetical protein HQK79_23245 [Desulfobacterales bacterium]|nr:hypothetical protein [Desulfobacterales bacterium]